MTGLRGGGGVGCDGSGDGAGSGGGGDGVRRMYKQGGDATAAAAAFLVTPGRR